MTNTFSMKVIKNMPHRFLCWFINLYRPFRGSLIKIKYISKDFRNICVEMPLKWRNKNYFGTHFGGSLYSMTDPFYCIMLANNLGNNYIIWGKEATIKFIKPGCTAVKCQFTLSHEDLEMIKQQIKESENRNTLFCKTVEIMDSQDVLIARVNKVIYIRKK